MEEQKTQEQEINIDELVLKVASAIENKNQKNEKSIVDSNFSKLPDNEKEQAYKAWEEKKTAWGLIGRLSENHIEERMRMEVCSKPSV